MVESNINILDKEILEIIRKKELLFIENSKEE